MNLEKQLSYTTNGGRHACFPAYIHVFHENETSEPYKVCYDADNRLRLIEDTWKRFMTFKEKYVESEVEQLIFNYPVSKVTRFHPGKFYLDIVLHIS